MSSLKQISILIPAYNEEMAIEPLYQKINQSIAPLEKKYQFELLFVSDGSEDRSIDVLKQMRKEDNRVSYIHLTRNFGKEIAIIAGMDYVAGDAAIIMDADLQHPPECIPEMIKHWEDGFEDVYAKQKNRDGESRLRRYMCEKYYQILQKTAHMPIYPNAGDFRLLDRRCLEAIKKLRETKRNTKFLYGWVGYKKKEIEYVAAPRINGETKWSYFSLINLALEGLTSSTTIPLRFSSFLGFFISLLALFYTIVTVIQTLATGIPKTGYPTLLVCILFLGGIQLISIGMIGEYLSRIFFETKQRPLYYVAEHNDRRVMP